MEQMETLIDHPHRFERFLSQALDSAVTMGTAYGLRAVGALIIFAVGWFMARQIQRGLIRVGRKSPRVDLTVATFIGGLAKYLIIAFTIVAMLASFGVETTSVVAVLGAAGIAIGLALQGTLSHVAAGFMLVLFRPFRVGDAIETAGVSGTVTEVSLFTTEIRSDNNVRIVIPNNAVWSGVTKNLSSFGTRRVDLEFPLPFRANIDVAVETAARIVAAETRVLKDPAPTIGLAKFTDATARLAVQVWTTVPQAGPVQLALATAIWHQFGLEGLVREKGEDPSRD